MEKGKKKEKKKRKGRNVKLQLRQYKIAGTLCYPWKHLKISYAYARRFNRFMNPCMKNRRATKLSENYETRGNERLMRG